MKQVHDEGMKPLYDREKLKQISVSGIAPLGEVRDLTKVSQSNM